MELFVTAFSEGGPVMYVIACFSIIAFAIIVERFYFILVRFNINGPAFMDQVRKLVNAGNVENAIKLCKSAGDSALARVAMAGLMRADKPEREIQDGVDEIALEVLPKLQKRTPYLQMIANVATLLGLLGTIIGIIIAFKAVAEEPDPAMKQIVLTKGISIALYTTAAGLIVAIPAMIAHAMIASKTTKIIDEIDEYSVKLINLLVAKQKERG